MQAAYRLSGATGSSHPVEALIGPRRSQVYRIPEANQRERFLMGSKASVPNCRSRRWEDSVTASPIRLCQRVRLRAIDSRPSRPPRLPGETQGSRIARIRVGTGPPWSARAQRMVARTLSVVLRCWRRWQPRRVTRTPPWSSRVRLRIRKT